MARESEGARITHAHAKLIFSRAWDGEATEEELAGLKAHIKDCPKCARRIEEMRAFYMEIEEVLLRPD